ncbi:hypothetical protein BBP40_004045 [Aspergillus hancockii]|nr:hypothetical protein BBP40_004045 [Aspergillus hancockii]
MATAMLGFARNPIPIDLDDNSVELSDGTSGDTIPETPSHRSQSPTSSGIEDATQVHLSFGDLESTCATDGNRTHSKADGQASVNEQVSGCPQCTKGGTIPPQIEQTDNQVMVHANTQTDDRPRSSSMVLQPSSAKMDSVTSILTYRLALDSKMELLCLEVKWRSYSELRQHAPGSAE